MWYLQVFYPRMLSYWVLWITQAQFGGGHDMLDGPSRHQEVQTWSQFPKSMEPNRTTRPENVWAHFSLGISGGAPCLIIASHLCIVRPKSRTMRHGPAAALNQYWPSCIEIRLGMNPFLFFLSLGSISWKQNNTEREWVSPKLQRTEFHC